MSSQAYSFLDVAVLDTVRRRFAAGDAMVILSTDLELVLWANGPGAALFGHAGVDDAIGAAAGLPAIARRQIASTGSFPDIGTDRPLLVRLTAGISGASTPLLASSVTMPDGEKAILLAVPKAPGDAAPAKPDPGALSGFDADVQFLAFINGKGHVEADSAGFSDLGIPASTLTTLVAEVAGERDRMVKRLIRAGARSYPAGIARLTDEPLRHLLVVVDDGMAEPAIMPRVDGKPAHATGDEVGNRHDHWYFSHVDKPSAMQERNNPTPSGNGTRDAHAAAPQEDAPAVRFVWRTDAEGRFSALSDEFGAAVGAEAANVIGRRFREVATTFGFDPGGEVAGLLERRDTWSGRSVLWPVAGTDQCVPVDLAALPVYNRDREFEGFRGFGIVRMAEMRADPEKIGLALVPNPPQPAEHFPSDETALPADPFNGEVPAISIAPQPERRLADKVIRLAEHRPPAQEPAGKDRGLSSSERNAFREIAERLRRDSTAAAPADEPKAEAPTAAEEQQTRPHRSPEQVVDVPSRRTSRSLLDYAQEDDNDSMADADFRDARLDGDAIGVSFEEDTVIGADEPSETAQAGLSSRLPQTEPAENEIAGTVSPDTTILSHLPVPLLIHAGDELHYCNDEFLALTGYESLSDLAACGGLDALFIDHPQEQVAADSSDEDHGRHALFLRTKDGGEFPVEAVLRSVPWQERKALMLVLRRLDDDPSGAGTDAEAIARAANAAHQADIAELKMRISEMRTIIDTATDGVVLIGRDGTIRSISRPAEALFGFDSDEVAGKTFASLFAIESQRAARDYLAGLTEPGVASVLNDGREVIGREAQGRFIPLFMTIGRLPNDSGFCAVVRDITQWKRAEEDLTQARALAERASSQKSDFLARISHEIRTPLNAIIGFSELMVDEKFGPIANDRYRDYLRDINRSGTHVLDLVNDLLDISKIEAGQQEMDYEAVSLNDTLAETVALMQPQANRERVIIRSSFASKLPDVVADLRSVRQIALNILSNAVRYTQAGGQVIVSTAYEPSGDVVMRVRDTGIGMTQAEIEQALKPFKQVNALKRGRSDGTGLGLPLTKAMVEANRARFTITSTPGEGTLVEVAFPSVRVLAG